VMFVGLLQRGTAARCVVPPLARGAPGRYTSLSRSICRPATTVHRVTRVRSDLRRRRSPTGPRATGRSEAPPGGPADLGTQVGTVGTLRHRGEGLDVLLARRAVVRLAVHEVPGDRRVRAGARAEGGVPPALN